MAYEGAAGITKAEMAEVLHVFANDEEFRESQAALRTALESSVLKSTRQTLLADGKDKIQLFMANRLYGQKDFAFLRPFLDTLEKTYRGQLEAVDFEQNPDQAREAINAWVEKQTQDKIQELIPEGGVTKRTPLILVNALYFKAAWMEGLEFEKSDTIPRPFYDAGGSESSVPTMMMEAKLYYAKHPGYTAVAIPYRGEDFQFVALVPDAKDGLAAMEKSLSPEDLFNCAEMPLQRVELYLPKFEMNSSALELSSALQTLGMKTAFDHPEDSADFSGIALRTPGRSIKMDKAYHKAFISVDEEGTVAAAATGVVDFLPGGAPPQSITVRLDRPFLFAIQHRPSGACLFLGRVVKPVAGLGNSTWNFEQPWEESSGLKIVMAAAILMAFWVAYSKMRSRA